jgi:hypothetical protein
MWLNRSPLGRPRLKAYDAPSLKPAHNFKGSLGCMCQRSSHNRSGPNAHSRTQLTSIRETVAQGYYQ